MEEARQRARQHTFLFWTSSVLHWFLLAGFITLFFWYRSHTPKIPPAAAPPAADAVDTSPLEGIGATVTDAEQEAAEDVGKVLGNPQEEAEKEEQQAAERVREVQGAATKGGGKGAAGEVLGAATKEGEKEAEREAGKALDLACNASDDMVAYYRKLDAITNAATKSRNARKRWTTIGVVIGLGVSVIALMAWGKCKVGITKGAWATMWLYSLVLFVIFCIFELFFFHRVIKKYASMGRVQQARVFVESLHAQVQDLVRDVSVPQSQADAGDPPLPKIPTLGVVLLREFIEQADDPALVAAMARLLGRTGLPL